MPVTMEGFTEHVRTSSRRGAELLRTQWLTECCDIIDEQRDNIEELMPADDPVRFELTVPDLFVFGWGKRRNVMIFSYIIYMTTTFH